MRRTLFIPACILLFIVLTTPAIAEPPPDKGKDKSVKAPVFVLMDSDPLGSKQVGFVIDFFTEDLLSEPVIMDEGDTRNLMVMMEAETSQGPRNVMAIFKPNGDIKKDNVFLLFTESECTGTVYTSLNVMNFSPAFTHSFVVPDATNTKRVLYVAPNNPSPVNINLLSGKNFNEAASNCPRGNLGSRNVIPFSEFEIADDDLFETYPPPYTLERR